MEARELAQRVADAVEARFCAAVEAPGVVTRSAGGVRIVMVCQGMLPADEIIASVTAPHVSDPRRWAVSVGYREAFGSEVHSFTHYTEPRDFRRALARAIADCLDHMDASF